MGGGKSFDQRGAEFLAALAQLNADLQAWGKALPPITIDLKGGRADG